MALFGPFWPWRAGVLHQPLRGPGPGAGVPSQGPGSLGTRAPGVREVWGPLGSRIRDPGVRGAPSRRGGEAPGGPGTGPGGTRVRGFTSTPRGGPPRFPGGVPGAPESRAGAPRGSGVLPGGPGTPLPREGPPAGTAGGGAPTGGEGRIPSSFRRKGVRSRPVPAGASPSPVCYGEGKSTRRTPSKKPSALT